VALSDTLYRHPTTSVDHYLPKTARLAAATKSSSACCGVLLRLRAASMAAVKCSMAGLMSRSDGPKYGMPLSIAAWYTATWVGTSSVYSATFAKVSSALAERLAVT